MLEMFALSLSSEIEKYGAYAGFASIPAVAILALLFFTQAREVKRLREWAGRAPERAQELQDRVSAQATQPPRPATAAGERRVAAQPLGGAGTAAAQRQTGGATAPPARPGAAPSPGAAPAAGAAASGASPSAPAKPAGAPAAPGSSTPGPSTPGGAPPTPGASPGTPPAAKPPSTPATPDSPAKPSEPVPVPAATAAGASARAAEPPAGTAGQAATAAPPRPASERTEVRSPGARPATAAPLRRGAPSATVPPRRGDGRGAGTGDHDRRRTIGIIAGAVIGVILVVVLVTQVLGGGGDSGGTASKPNTVSSSSPAKTSGSNATGGAQVNRGDVTVSVLNGTTVPGLAAQVADQLSGGGFARGQVTNAADQQRSETTVQYAPGQRQAAVEVARIIKVPASKVSSLDANTQAIAGPDAEVVVTVGADRTQ